MENQELSKVDNMINSLVDENFGNEEQRKKMCSLLFSLYRTKDPEAKAKVRKLFKYLGDSMNSFSEETKFEIYTSLYEKDGEENKDEEKDKPEKKDEQKPEEKKDDKVDGNKTDNKDEKENKNDKNKEEKKESCQPYKRIYFNK